MEKSTDQINNFGKNVHFFSYLMNAIIRVPSLPTKVSNVIYRTPNTVPPLNSIRPMQWEPQKDAWQPILKIKTFVFLSLCSL